MEKMEKEYTLSLYSNLSALRNSQKSSVYLVQNEVSGKIYIKKELKTYNIEVFKALKRIKHRNTPRIYEFIELDDTLYIIEEFINGNTLEEILKEQGPLEEELVIHYVLDLCEILNLLHNEKLPIIHRDIKPSNIIISNDNVLKLIDFDVSRIFKEEGNEDTHILGTKGYASPEQFGFDQTDCRSDIYSLGVLMNVLTTGDYPKNRRNRGSLSDIIERCTHIAAEKRYENVKELRAELLKIIPGEEPEFEEATKVHSMEVNEGASRGYNKVNSRDNSEYFYDHYEICEEGEEAQEDFASDTSEFFILQDENSTPSQEAKDNFIVRFIKELPGFRTKNPIKILIAFSWYFFLAVVMMISLENFNIFTFLENLSMVAGLLAMTFLTCNYRNIRKALPMVRSNNLLMVIVGLIIYNFIIFFLAGAGLTFFGGFK